VTRAYVLDTSYLLEIYGVPGHYNDNSQKEIKTRLVKAIKAESRLYVPFPAIFELANHIAHVDDGARRNALARKLSEDIRLSLEYGVPWIVTPVPTLSVLLELSGLLELVEEFESVYAAQGIGLSDIAVINLARSLEKRACAYLVHIWTRDHVVKAREPVPEPDPFV
jgi:hypothetical protein